jgi:hypothetical protein
MESKEPSVFTSTYSEGIQRVLQAECMALLRFLLDIYVFLHIHM